MALTSPSAVLFDLNVRDRATFEKAYRLEAFGRYGNLAPGLILVSTLLQTIGPAARLYRLHGHDPESWVVLVVVLPIVAVLSAFIFLRSPVAPPFIVPVGATVVTFETSGLSVERTRAGARTTRLLSFARMRSVRLLSHAIVISSGWGLPLLIPRAALPDGGAELMSFLDDRLTGKRMLVRSSLSRTTIVEGISTSV